MNFLELQALKEFDVKELLKRQKELDLLFENKKTFNLKTRETIVTALYVELAELAQELKPLWNRWKISVKEIDKRKTLEELSDVLHFILSLKNFLSNDNIKKEITTAKEYKKKVELFKKRLEERRKRDKNVISFLINDIFYYVDVIDLGGNQFDEIIVRLMVILSEINVSIEEFLQVHHEVFLRNANVRTKEIY